LGEKKKEIEMKIYRYIADLFRYPTVETLKSIQYVSEMLIKKDVALAAQFEDFAAFYADKPFSTLEEYYITTFDVRAVCHLDIGYVIFGDDSKRGRFLYHIKEEQEKTGNDCGKDLADFLPNILTLLAKTNDKEFAEELSVSILLPALEQMNQKLAKEKNIFSIPMDILIKLLKTEFGESEYEAVKIGTKEKPGFLNHYITGIDTSLFERKKYKNKR
jgi:nitrate reductase assembly molybdenum cofactor insertion protein NarJ